MRPSQAIELHRKEIRFIGTAHYPKLLLDLYILIWSLSLPI